MHTNLLLRNAAALASLELRHRFETERVGSNSSQILANCAGLRHLRTTVMLPRLPVGLRALSALESLATEGIQMLDSSELVGLHAGECSRAVVLHSLLVASVADARLKLEAADPWS